MRLKTMLTATLAALAAIVLSTSHAAAQVKTFKIDGNGGSQIQFVSDATLEKITGVTTTVNGEIKVDLQKPAGAKATIKVPVKSIRTGIDLRDEHLCKDNWLDCGNHADAIFVITSVSGLDKIKPNEGHEVTVKGKFTIHGVTRDITTTARIRYIPASEETKANKVQGDMLRVQASFKVPLEEHNVSIPPIVSLKVAEVIEVNVDLRATTK